MAASPPICKMHNLVKDFLQLEETSGSGNLFWLSGWRRTQFFDFWIFVQEITQLFSLITVKQHEAWIILNVSYQIDTKNSVKIIVKITTTIKSNIILSLKSNTYCHVNSCISIFKILIAKNGQFCVLEAL